MASHQTERLSYQAWGLSLAVHTVMVGLAAVLSMQVTPLVKDEVFHWEVALVDSVRERTEPEPAWVPPPQPVVHSVAPRSASQSVVSEPVTPPPTPLETPVTRAVPVEPPPPSVMMKPVEPVERHAEPVERHQTEPVRAEAIVSPAPVQAAHAEPVVTEGAASMASWFQRDTTPVVHHDSPSPDEMASEWRTLTPVQAVPSHRPVESMPVAVSPEHAAPIVAAAPPLSVAALVAPPVPAKSGSVPSATKADNVWLAESLGRRIRELTRYPSTARLNGWEGKVVVRVVIRADGHLAEATVHRSSGHEVLDRAALETIRLACPLHMKQTLSTEQVAVYVPIVYSLAG